MNIDKLYINDVDIQEQYGFWLNWRVLSAPAPQLSYQVIPGKHGRLDLSEALGDVYYDDRSLTINMTHPSDEWHADYQSFTSAFHGRSCYIKFSNDDEWYWYGRVIVGQYDSEEHSLSMTATVFPFKLATQETEVETVVTATSQSNAQTISLQNGRMKVTPKVTVTGATNGVNLKWGTNTTTLGNGEYYVTGLTLDEGTLNVLAWGDGTVTFTYRQGAL